MEIYDKNELKNAFEKLKNEKNIYTKNKPGETGKRNLKSIIYAFLIGIILIACFYFIGALIFVSYLP